MEEVVEVEETTEEQVEEHVEETTTETEQAEETPVEEEKKPGVSAGVQKRIDQLTRKNYDGQRTIGERDARIAELESQVPSPSTKGKPTLEDFDYDTERHSEALVDWKVDQRLQAQEDRLADRQQQETNHQKAQDYQSRVERTVVSGIAAYDDFNDVVSNNQSLEMTTEMADVLSSSEKGHDIAYYLGKNPAESSRIARLSPMAQAMEIGKIEAGLTIKPVKKPTAAPDPTTSLGSRGSQAATLNPSNPDGSVNRAWVKARNEGKI